MGTTSNFGLSVALVAPWMTNGTLTSFLDQNNETLRLHDRLLLVSTGNTFPLCTLEFIVSCTSFVTSLLASTIVGENARVQRKMNNFLYQFTCLA
jgi:hypothetical protein